MTRVTCFLAVLAAVLVLALNSTSASAFGWCGGYSTSRSVVAPRARVYGYTALRPVLRSGVYRGRYLRPGLRRR